MKPEEPLAKLRETLVQSYGNHAIAPGEANYIDRHLRRYAQTLKFLPDRPGALLDVGCFPGHTSLLAAAQGWSVVGVSRFDGVFLTAAFAERMKEQGIAVLNADVERDRIPVGDETFDCVFFNEIVEHLPFNPFHALDEVWRVLKPGGRLVFSVPNFASFDHLWALLRVRSFYPDLARPLEDAFHADIGQRHIREYTPGECRHLLEEQDKYLYRFAIERIVMDRSWDGIFYTEQGEQPALSKIRPGTVLRALVTRLCPRFRSNIVVLAGKPRNYVRLPASAIQAEGFHPPESSGVSASFLRNPLQASWMTASAKLHLEIPSAVRSVTQIELLVWMPAPLAAGALKLTPSVAGMGCETLTVRPSSEPVRRVIRFPKPVPFADARRTLTIDLTSTVWSPKSLGFAGDDRTLGPMIALEQAAVVAGQVA